MHMKDGKEAAAAVVAAVVETVSHPDNNNDDLTKFRRIHTLYRKRAVDYDGDVATMIDIRRHRNEKCMLYRLEDDDDDDRPAAYGLRGRPGLIIYPAALSVQEQNTLARSAVTDYCCWSAHDNKNDAVRTNLPPMFSSSSYFSDKKDINKHVAWNEYCNYYNNNKEEGFSTKQSVTSNNNNSMKRPPPPRKLLLDRLSWATLGYHYNWTTRSYHTTIDDNDKSSSSSSSSVFLPDSLVNVAKKFGLDHAQTALIKYYSGRDCMGVHVDDAEDKNVTNDRLVSISLGRAAVFLIESGNDETGAKLGIGDDDDSALGNKFPAAFPLLLRSGDVLCLTGPARRAVHSMPRLLPIASSLPSSDDDNDDDANLHRFLATHRVNISLRQVHS